MNSNARKSIKVSENSSTCRKPQVEMGVFENEKSKSKGKRT